MQAQNENLLEALRQAQKSLERCEVFYGESNDDSCRIIYNRIKELLAEQRSLVEGEIAMHKNEGRWEE